VVLGRAVVDTRATGCKTQQLRITVLCTMKETRLEVEVIAYETSIQAQACFTFAPPINCLTLFSVVCHGSVY
jgi:hypothetical protein